MKALDFKYWLQGLFELTTPVTITTTRAELIDRHLKMVEEFQEYDLFCVWLRGVLDGVSGGAIDETLTDKIQTRLDRQFKHVVVTNKPTTQTGPDYELMRC